MFEAIKRVAGFLFADTPHGGTVWKLEVFARTLYFADGNPFTPLFEEERHTGSAAMVTQPAEPICRFHRQR